MVADVQQNCWMRSSAWEAKWMGSGPLTGSFSPSKRRACLRYHRRRGCCPGWWVALPAGRLLRPQTAPASCFGCCLGLQLSGSRAGSVRGWHVLLCCVLCCQPAPGTAAPARTVLSYQRCDVMGSLFRCKRCSRTLRALLRCKAR